MGNVSIDLPPGFRFHPTDEEIITYYLSPKAMDPSFTTTAIGEVDLNKFEPWDLPNKAKMGEKEWYFFCQKDRKYPTGTRTNRATKAGYWKATGKDKEIFKGEGVLVGMKKTLVFYMGRAPKGEKTNWVMHEFRIEVNPSRNLPRIVQDEWVVSRVFHKKLIEKNMPMEASFFSGGSSSYETSNIRDMEANANLFNNTLPYTSGVNPDFPLCEQQDLAAMEVLAEANDESNFAVRRHCKVEQFSKQPTMMSANTAEGSTDWYDHELDDPGSFAYHCIDLDDICNY